MASPFRIPTIARVTTSSACGTGCSGKYSTTKVVILYAEAFFPGRSCMVDVFNFVRVCYDY